jgi:hypothetical protein
MGLLSRGSVQSYFYLFEGLGINSPYAGDLRFQVLPGLHPSVPIRVVRG